MDHKGDHIDQRHIAITHRRMKENGGSGAWRMFVSGGAAGMIARTASAPFDRIKLLFQVQAVSPALGQGAYTGILQSLGKIYREEGLLALWRGNTMNILRVFPYSASQMSSNDLYKRFLDQETRPLSVAQRLLAGAMAGVTATTLTHPLDTLRLRMAVPVEATTSSALSISAHITHIYRHEGLASLYRGLSPAIVGIAPFAAIQFTSYDILKTWGGGGGGGDRSTGSEAPAAPRGFKSLAAGAMAGTIAGTVCYPLDTVRRRMQLPKSSRSYSSQLEAFKSIWRVEGPTGFYRGYMANTLKMVPQTAIRFLVYDEIKKFLGVSHARTDS